MKYIIGVAGENGSGKATFTTFLKAAAAPHKVARLRFSDVLFDTLKIWGIPISRSNLQNLAIIMDKQYGKGSLTMATKNRINQEIAEIIVLEGVRWKTDVPMIKSFPHSFLVYVTASPKLRFERMRKRGEKAGEAKATYSRFLAEEKAATEIDIPRIGRKADVAIENNGTIDELREKVEEFYRKNFK